MDIQSHKQLLDELQQKFTQKELDVTYTQWEGDTDDEEVTQFRGTLHSVELTENEFEEMDLLFVFQTDEEEIEVLMEIPKEESDLATTDEKHLRIFGTEAEIELTR